MTVARPAARRNTATSRKTGQRRGEAVFLAFQRNLDLACRDKIHGVGGVTLTHDNFPWLHHLGPQQFHHVDISAASSSANSGTREIMPQVTMKSRRWICSAKAVAMIPTGNAINTRPAKS